MKYNIPVNLNGDLLYCHIEGELSKEEYEHYFSLATNRDRNEYLIQCGEIIIVTFNLDSITYNDVEFEKVCVNATDRCVGSFPCPYCETKND